MPFDTTGQLAPPGMKPRVTATLWEDEGSLCFQVEAKGVCVARREDNHFINGTKLLNVAGMTRGRRDGILKSEKTRNVVKIGPMHLKGVWIPFERALEFANREKITDLLYPLFVHNIGGLLYDPANANRTNAVVSAADRRRLENAPVPRPLPMSQPPTLQHSNTMANPVGAGNQNSQAVSTHAGTGRPSLDRAHTFPTPPTSASSVIGSGNASSSYNDWSGQSLPGTLGTSQPLSIDTGLSNTARSMPTTPATTPPGNNMQNMQQYQHSQGYDAKHYYSGPPSQPSYTTPQSLDRYGQNNTSVYVKNEMGPPSTRGPGLHQQPEQHEYKNDQYSQRPASAHLVQQSGEHDGTQVHDHEYMQNGNGAYGTDRSAYAYGSGHSVSGLQGANSHVSPAMNGSPSQPSGPGHVTPRTTNPSQPSWASGYHTPPRQPQPNTSPYGLINDSRVGGQNGGSDGYTPPNYTTSVLNGTPGSKRGREDDDQDQANGLEPAYDLKRRRTLRDEPMGAGVVALPAMQTQIKAGGGPRRR
ncbi:putative apses transcription factor [Phaeomoniella chlamydospora]|uniref:Cell pattern formation-associated protein STUA n=1 Tax=Phaeomoniella chlamydospora TaxID=158046 RepID=A0A0G2FS01_PHACM|nr:putative apses transcription factor [Phaeomoniella chlamydospora]